MQLGGAPIIPVAPVSILPTGSGRLVLPRNAAIRVGLLVRCAPASARQGGGLGWLELAWIGRVVGYQHDAPPGAVVFL